MVQIILLRLDKVNTPFVWETNRWDIGHSGSLFQSFQFTVEVGSSLNGRSIKQEFSFTWDFTISWLQYPIRYTNESNFTAQNFNVFNYSFINFCISRTALFLHVYLYGNYFTIFSNLRIKWTLSGHIFIISNSQHLKVQNIESYFHFAPLTLTIIISFIFTRSLE